VWENSLIYPNEAITVTYHITPHIKVERTIIINENILTLYIHKNEHLQWEKKLVA
jgi:hypothetical protein